MFRTVSTLIGMYLIFSIGMTVGKTSVADVKVIDPLPANFYAEETVATRLCTDKFNNTIVASRVRTGKTSITD